MYGKKFVHIIHLAGFMDKLLWDVTFNGQGKFNEV